MRRGCVLLMVLPWLGSCAPTAQERVRELSNDGRHLYQRGAYADAREQFRAALAIRPQDPDLIYNVANCHEKLGNLSEADQLYRQVLHHNPDHLEARHALLVRQVEAGRQEIAEKMAQDWLRASPGLPGPYIEDGWLRARAGDLDSARGRFQQALEIEPRNPRALNELARVYEKLHRPDRAIVLYERSLEADLEQPAIRARLEQLRARGVPRPHPD